MTLERPMFPPADASRRRFLSQAAGVAAGSAALSLAPTIPSSAKASQGLPDRILGAIDVHKAARAALDHVLMAQTSLETELPRDKRRSNIVLYEENIFETDDPRWIEAERAVMWAFEAEESAAIALVCTQPTTKAGMLALLQYALAADTDGDGWPRELQSDDGKIIRSWHYFLLECLSVALPNCA
jgi:hypothetical protein